MRLLPAMIFLVACAGNDRAIDPVWGKQACAACAMLVSDPRTSAQLVTKDGERLYFDDVGCLASSEKRHGALGMWVRDAEGHWLNARSARFGKGATPMDYGFVVAQEGVDFGTVERAVAARAGVR